MLVFVEYLSGLSYVGIHFVECLKHVLWVHAYVGHHSWVSTSAVKFGANAHDSANIQITPIFRTKCLHKV